MVQLSDTAGAVTKTYDYDAFGNEKNMDVNDTNPMRYAGEYFDLETGTYYLRARQYDPGSGRFITEDPYWNPGNMIYDSNQVPSMSSIMQNANLYVYCMSNPVCYLDSQGLWAITVTGGASVQFGVAGRFDTGIAFDGHGNLTTLASVGLGGGSPSAGIGMQAALYNSDTIYSLAGLNMEVGASAGPAVSIGLDYIKNSDGTHGFGVTIGTSVIPVETHAFFNYAWVGENLQVTDFDTTGFLIYLNSVLSDSKKQQLNSEVFGFTVFLIGNNTGDYYEYYDALYKTNAILEMAF